MYVPFSVFCVLFVCKFVLFYCHRVSTQLQLNKYIYIYHIISYHIKEPSVSMRCGECFDRLKTSPVELLAYVVVWY
jgi:hypothetical protein